MVNNFSVILGGLPGFNQYKAMGKKCLTQGRYIETRNLAIKSLTLSQLSYRCSLTMICDRIQKEPYHLYESVSHSITKEEKFIVPKKYPYDMSLVMRKPAFCCTKTKAQISFAVTAKLISTFVFATCIVQSLYFLNTKFQASSQLLWLYSPVSVGSGRKPRRPVFPQRGLYLYSKGYGKIGIS